MGLPASGKSRLAEAWARKHGFSYFSFDSVQKQFAAVSEVENAGQQVSLKADHRAPDMLRRTYDALLAYAEQELEAGNTVVLDAIYGARQERIHLVELADRMQITPYFVLCYCSEKATKARMAERAPSAEADSSAQWQVFKKQQEELDPLDDLEPTKVVSINTESPQDELIKQLDYAFEKRKPVTVVMQ